MGAPPDGQGPATFLAFTPLPSGRADLDSISGSNHKMFANIYPINMMGQHLRN